MDFKRQLEHTRIYAQAFWQHEMLDRPYVSVTAPMQPSSYEWTPAKSFQACMNEDYNSILEPFVEPVSYTHLDVYKRQSHDDGSLDRDKKEVLTVYVSKEVIVSSEVTSSEDDFFGFEW